LVLQRSGNGKFMPGYVGMIGGDEANAAHIGGEVIDSLDTTAGRDQAVVELA
jgi:hypothetical protein